MEDGSIVQLYWDRDEQAIPATAEKYGNYCASVAKNILDRREDAEECVNDTYMSAWNAMPPHRPQILSAFLGKLTRNLSLNRYKQNTAGKRGGGQAMAVLDELAPIKIIKIMATITSITFNIFILFTSYVFIHYFF